jgi:hypothetical protein
MACGGCAEGGAMLGEASRLARSGHVRAAARLTVTVAAQAAARAPALATSAVKAGAASLLSRIR